MKYYLVSNSCDEKVIGPEYHQTEGHPLGVIPEFSNTEFIEHDMPLPYTLEKKAILTDVVSASNMSACGFLMNQRTKDIFEKFNLYEHKFYPANLVYNNLLLKYYWLNILDAKEEMIDYKKSTFAIYNRKHQKIENYTIDSFEDIENTREELVKEYRKTKILNRIALDNIVYNNHFFDNKYDLFFNHLLEHEIFISEKLYQSLMNHNITGLEFKEQNLI